MKAGRFYSCAYDARHNPKVDMMRDWGDGLVEYARWHVLLSVVYDQWHALLVGHDWYDPETGELTKEPPLIAKYLAKEMELDLPGLIGWLDAAAEAELIEMDNWKRLGSVIPRGAANEMEYADKMKENGKKGGRPKKNQAENQT